MPLAFGPVSSSIRSAASGSPGAQRRQSFGTSCCAACSRGCHAPLRSSCAPSTTRGRTSLCSMAAVASARMQSSSARTYLVPRGRRSLSGDAQQLAGLCVDRLRVEQLGERGEDLRREEGRRVAIHAASIEVERGMKPAARGGGRDATRGRASARGCRRTCRRGRRTFRHGAAEEEGAEQGRRQGGAALRSLEEAFALFVELQREAGRLEIALDILRLLWSHLGESVAGRRRCRGPRSLRRDVAPQWQARLWHRHLEHKAELRDEDDVELVVERVLRHQ